MTLNTTLNQDYDYDRNKNFMVFRNRAINKYSNKKVIMDNTMIALIIANYPKLL